MFRPVQPTFTTPDGVRVTRFAEPLDEPVSPATVTIGTVLDLRDTPTVAGEKYYARADAPVTIEISLDGGATWHDGSAGVAQSLTVGVAGQVKIRPKVAPYGTADNPIAMADVWVDGVPVAAGWRS